MIKLIDLVKEVGSTVDVPSDFKKEKLPSAFGDAVLYKYLFKIQDRDVEVTLGDWKFCINKLDPLFGTDYETEIRDQIDKLPTLDILSATTSVIAKLNIPQEYLNAYIVGFSVDRNYESTNTRKTEKSSEEEMQTLKSNDSWHRSLVSELLKLENLLKNYDKDNEISKKWSKEQLLKAMKDVKEDIAAWQARTSAKPLSKTRNINSDSSTAEYLEILSTVTSVINKFIKQYNPSILIINYDTDSTPYSVMLKRNSIYKYFARKLNSEYTLHQRGNFLYATNLNLG